MPPLHLQKRPTDKEIRNHFSDRDPVMYRVICDIGPLKLKRNRNYFLVLCKAIIAQQKSTRAAQTITSRFHDLFDGHSPNPETVFNMKEKSLQSVGLSRQKTAYLKDLSRHFLNKEVRPHQLPYLDNEEVVCRLTAIYGIGRWTAEMFLIFSLSRMNVLPVSDLGLLAAIKDLYHMRKLPSARRVQALGKKWHPLETVGTWYAWRFRDAENIAY